LINGSNMKPANSMEFHYRCSGLSKHLGRNTLIPGAFLVIIGGTHGENRVYRYRCTLRGARGVAFSAAYNQAFTKRRPFLTPPCACHEQNPVG
jgi:hypothetical protein